MIRMPQLKRILKKKFVTQKSSIRKFYEGVVSMYGLIHIYARLEKID